MTLERLKRVFPGGDDRWLGQVIRQAPGFGIDTPEALASFCAQFGHETAGFTRFEENLSYSAQRLMQVWPRRFPDLTSALPYARNPEALAERVYGRRMGNVNPGDGYKYRGRGPQVTGRTNYGKASALVGLDLLDRPELLLVPAIGVEVACRGWQALGLCRLDDDDDARAETRIINGGEIGLKDRQRLLDDLRRELLA